jgi:branched-chain amino acid transport system ATP-binding protein
MTGQLSCSGLTAGYNGSPVVRGVSFDLAPSQVLALLGPNGAGKTTTLLALAGLLERSAGEVRVGGRPLAGGNPRLASREGIVLVPDDRALFTTLTVMENLRLASRSRPRLDMVLDLFPRLRDRLTVDAGVLSGGEQQMLAIGRALVQDPHVLLIDELSMGLAPVIVQSLLPIIRRVADETGAAVVLVEQHVSLALAVADVAVVLAHGEEVLSGTAADLMARPELVEAAYLSSSPAT